jgi:hypothetical protein
MTMILFLLPLLTEKRPVVVAVVVVAEEEKLGLNEVNGGAIQNAWQERMEGMIRKRMIDFMIAIFVFESRRQTKK